MSCSTTVTSDSTTIVSTTEIDGILVHRAPRCILLGEIDWVMAMGLSTFRLPGFYTVVAHGTRCGSKLSLRTPSGTRAIGAPQLASILRKQPDYGGQPVHLLVCWAGLTAGGLAARLDSELGHVGVVAASDEVDVQQRVPSLPNQGSWHLFRDGKVLLFRPTWM